MFACFWVSFFMESRNLGTCDDAFPAATARVKTTIAPIITARSPYCTPCRPHSVFPRSQFNGRFATESGSCPRVSGQTPARLEAPGAALRAPARSGRPSGSALNGDGPAAAPSTVPWGNNRISQPPPRARYNSIRLWAIWPRAVGRQVLHLRQLGLGNEHRGEVDGALTVLVHRDDSRILGRLCRRVQASSSVCGSSGTSRSRPPPPWRPPALSPGKRKPPAGTSRPAPGHC